MAGQRPDEAGFDPGQVFTLQINGVFLPFFGQLDGAALAAGAIGIFFVCTQHAEFESDGLAALFATRPEFQLLRTSQIPAASLITPIVGGVLPDNASPFTGLGIFEAQTVFAAMRIGGETLIHLDALCVAHPTRGDVVVVRAALFIENGEWKFDCFRGGRVLSAEALNACAKTDERASDDQASGQVVLFHDSFWFWVCSVFSITKIPVDYLFPRGAPLVEPCQVIRVGVARHIGRFGVDHPGISPLLDFSVTVGK